MELASRVLGKLNLTDDAAVADQMACAAWRGAVGKRLAAHTHALKLVRHTLVVEVEDKIWQQQLFGLRFHFVSKLAAKIGPGLVEEVEFRIGAQRMGPGRALAATPSAEFALAADDADLIGDPGLRRIYKMKRKKALA